MHFFRTLALALTIGFSFTALAARFDEATPMRVLLAYFQQTYADTNRDYPIHLLDRDDLDWRIAKAGAFGEKNLEKRVRVLRDYLREKTGVLLTEGEVAGLEAYVTVRKESAYALPLFGNDKKHKVCVVFPADASSNQRLEHERVLGLQIPGVYEHGFAQLRVKMEYAELRLFSLVHEMGHCFDRWYMPANAPYGEDVYLTHQAEGFAETFAALVLAREGWGSLAERRGTIRTIYARKIGEFIAKNPGFGDSNAMYGGLQYHLAPALAVAAQEIASAPPSMATALGDLIGRARAIVEKALLPRQSFNAVGSSYAQGREAAFELFRKLAQENPVNFERAYRDLRRFYETTDPVLEKIFDPGLKERLKQTPLSELAPPSLCALFRAPDRAGLQTRLDGWRRELARDLDVPSKQRQRADELRALFARLQQACPNN